MKHAIIVLLLVCSPAFATLTKVPTNCSSRPCVYTITCAAATCDATEKGEVQTALDDAHLGDTVKLEAGRRFLYDAYNDPLEVTKRTSGTGYLLITTTKDSELPAAGTRITPAYEDIVPWIGASEANTPGLLIVGDDTDQAEHVKIVGVGFDWGPNLAGFGPLLIGYNNVGGGSQFGYSVSDAANQPDDIIIDRCLFISQSGDHLTTTQYNIRANGSNIVIKDSYMEGAYRTNGGETQTIYSANGPGPITITNNFIGAGSENLFFGSGENTDTPPADLDIGYNYIPKVPERWRFEDWSASMTVFKGKMIRSTDTTKNITANNTGTTGSVEPTWPAAGNTVVDNDITWEVSSVSRTFSKNNFEIKSALRWNFHHNVIDGDWVGDGSQYAAVALKITNARPQDCIPYITGTVDTDGVTVTHVSGGPLPATHNGLAGSTDITINSVDYTVSDFEVLDANQLTLTATAGSQSGVAYTYGVSTCLAAYDKTGMFAHNIVRNVPSPLAVAPWINGQWANLGDLTFRHNLAYKVDCATWSDFNGSCGSGQQFFLVSMSPAGVTLDHNTMIFPAGADNSRGLYFGGTTAEYPSNDLAITNNVWTCGDGAYCGLTGDSAGEGACWSAGATQKFCVPNPSFGECTATQWNKNIIAGVRLTDRYDCLDGDTWNLCVDGTACSVDLEYDDATYGKLYENFDAGLYVVRTDGGTLHYAKRGGTDGADLGVDFTQLPMIRDVRVSPTDDKALVEFWVHPPIKDIPCVVQVKTGDYDFDEPDGYVTDLDPDTYAQPDSSDHDRNVKDGLKRMFIVGANAALSASTKHYYRIMCGGDAYPQIDETDPSFTTLGALTSTKDLSFKVTYAGNLHVEYGYDYSRTTDAIQSPADTGDSACGSGCSISVTANRGDILYWRFEETGNAGQVWPVRQLAVQ